MATGRSATKPAAGLQLGDRDTRWAYITGDLVLRHIDMASNRPFAEVVLGESFWSKLAHGRMIARIPDMIADLTTQWRLG
ncbi:hypothetical protein ACQPXH_19845 [Nocardia sp. CA-135953]|uniref:hypothetical protein n=1 Tax=Nocardia sp. CA-135953 TaxID=3239978 RepID=UPI003D98FE67